MITCNHNIINSIAKWPVIMSEYFTINLRLFLLVYKKKIFED